jgi:hypothetical protein
MEEDGKPDSGFEAEGPPRLYKAFTARKRTPMFVCIPRPQDRSQDEAFPYIHVLGITLSKDDTEIFVHLPDNRELYLRGKNLRIGGYYLLAHMVNRIQAFDPEGFDEPESGEPVIYEIRFGIKVEKPKAASDTPKPQHEPETKIREAERS